MKQRRIAWILLSIWLVTYCWSFGSLFLTEATGDGFTRGLNRVTSFFGWQILAGSLALVIWWLGRHFERKTLARWICRLPVTLAGLLFLACVGLIVAANFRKPAPQTAPTPSPKPVTAPAMELPDETANPATDE